MAWCDQIKAEDVSNGSVVDWRISAKPALRNAFLEYVSTPLNNSDAAVLASNDAAAKHHWQFLPSFQAYHAGLLSQAGTSCNVSAPATTYQVPEPQVCVKIVQNATHIAPYCNGATNLQHKGSQPSCKFSYTAGGSRIRNLKLFFTSFVKSSMPPASRAASVLTVTLYFPWESKSGSSQSCPEAYSWEQASCKLMH